MSSHRHIDLKIGTIDRRRRMARVRRSQPVRKVGLAIRPLMRHHVTES